MWGFLDFTRGSNSAESEAQSKEKEKEKKNEEKTSSSALTKRTEETQLNNPTTTATTSEHPYPLSHNLDGHVYSISSPTLKELKTNDNKDVTDEKKNRLEKVIALHI